MRRLKTITVLGLATAAAVAAAMLSQEEPTTVAGNGDLMLPGLMARINDTEAVEVVSGGKSFSLARAEGRWVIPEKSGYPAAADQVRDLLLGMAELRRVEPKTSKPELYEKLGLGDATKEATQSTRYSIETGGGQTLASLIVGKRSPATSELETSEFFVRVPEDLQTWLVVGKLPTQRQANAWLDKRILEIEEKRVRRVTVSHPGGERIVVEKEKPEDADFKLRGLAEGREIESQYSVNNVARTLTALSLEDVEPASEVKFEDDAGVTAVLETFDGLRVSVRTERIGDKALARFSASYDPALVEPDEKVKVESEDSPDTTGESSGVKKDGSASATKSTAENVEAEVERLNHRWSSWVYRIASYKVDDIGKKKADLVKQDEKKKEQDS